MNINRVVRKIDNKINEINSKLNEKWINFKRFKSISNTSLLINNNKTKDNTTSTLPMCDYIKTCGNILDLNKNSILINEFNKVDLVSSNHNNQETNELEPSNNTNALDKLDKLAKELNNFTDGIEIKNIKKLPGWITNSGKKELNTEQKLSFKKEKTRSFKNLLKPFTSPIKFINRSLLPIKINFESKNVNESLNEFRFDNESNNNDAFRNFSNKLNQLNKTFIDNVDKVMSEKVRGHKKIDIVIKYQTLERALECKLINDIKILNDEFKTDLAKSKFQENYYDLPDKINSKLDSIFNSNSISNLNIDEFFSSEIIDNLRDFLKKMINSQNDKINTHNIINNAINSVMSKKNKIITEFINDPEGIKEEFSLNLTKELFKNISKDPAFIGEQNAIAKIDNLIKKVKDDVAEEIGKPKGKTINYLKNSFYENIKSSDNGEGLLIRLFKNSSNNIHYKWAQDAVLLLINYETFENKDDQISSTNYISDGVVEYGGDGSEKKQKTTIETILGGIFSRLGLSEENLDKSKDEVLRKYFANYF